MIAIGILNIIIALGIMQYSIERKHPKFVIAMELLIMLASAAVLVFEYRDSQTNNKGSQKPAHQIFIDSIYQEGYKKGLVDCNKK